MGRKARILEDNSFGGIYSEEWLSTNKHSAEWNLTDLIPDGEIKIPKWQNSTWIENISIEEEISLKEARITEIEKRYTSLINKLVFKHVEKYIIDGTPIPREIKDQRMALRNECNTLINQL